MNAQTLIAGEDIQPGRLVVLSGPRTVVAGAAGDIAIGVTLAAAAEGRPAAVALVGGLMRLHTSSAMVAGALAHTDSGGKVSTDSEYGSAFVALEDINEDAVGDFVYVGRTPQP